MKRADIERIARETLERGLPESDCVEYKKSDTFAAKILKTACAFANNYNNRELGLLFIGVDEVDDPSRDAKAVPVRPIAGVAPESVEPIENRLKALFANVHPRVDYTLVEGELDGRTYIAVAVEPGAAGPYAAESTASTSPRDVPGGTLTTMPRTSTVMGAAQPC